MGWGGTWGRGGAGGWERDEPSDPTQAVSEQGPCSKFETWAVEGEAGEGLAEVGCSGEPHGSVTPHTHCEGGQDPQGWSRGGSGEAGRDPSPPPGQRGLRGWQTARGFWS